VADDGKADAVHVAGPEGRKPTRAEAEAMAAALFEALTNKQRDDKNKRDNPPE
jgi:hypothetical protein